MKSRLEIWKFWRKHTQYNILYKLLVLLKLRHSQSFEFLLYAEELLLYAEENERNDRY